MKFKGNKGFTLIEFVVIISIFAIMAGVALVNFSGFRTNIGLNNLAHDIALTIRQAQVFGWSTTTDIGTSQSIQLDEMTGNPKRYAEGVFFKFEGGAFAKEFILYTKADATAGNEFYVDTQGVADVVRDVITIQGLNHIAAIRYANTKDDLMIGQDGLIPSGLGEITESVSIAFSRPRPESLFFAGSVPLTLPDYTFIGIYISADNDADEAAQHVITISRFGEIAVQ